MERKWQIFAGAAVLACGINGAASANVDDMAWAPADDRPREMIAADGRRLSCALNGDLDVCYDQDGKPYSGELREFYPDGKLREKAYSRNGKLEGRREIYNENGVLTSSGDYVGGKMNGEWIVYFANGEIFARGNFKSNKTDGVWKMYWENGKINHEVSYKDGVRDGLSLTYDEDGKLYSKMNYKNGKLNGPSIFYYESGQPGLVAVFKDDEFVLDKCYDRQGYGISCDDL